MTIIEQANKIRKDINVLTTSLTDEQGLTLASLFEPWTLKAYAIGDKVTFEGKKHTSKINGNIWSPTAYPQGWQIA